MITTVICAAGSGERAGLPDNKIFYELNGLPVLAYSLSAFAPFSDELLVACREEDEARILPLLSPYRGARTVRGGKTRTESVRSALREAKGDIVLIHDAARPFVTAQIIEGCIRSVERHGSGVCAIPATDTTVLAKDGSVGTSLPRQSVYRLQTPQGFGTEALRRAYEAAFSEGAEGRFTDDSGVYGAYIGQPRLCAGDPHNRKLTYPDDFKTAERVGFGVDTHAFAHQDEIDRGIARLNLNYLRLCGAAIPSDRAIEAHSDGDVPVHALMDALLSAAGLRDIGFYFPPDDPAYDRADSMELLKKVTELVRAEGFCVGNASIAILAEKPRLSPYIETMRENLRAALGTDAVAVAAGTNEKLGYIGEGRGITAYAAVLLRKADI